MRAKHRPMARLERDVRRARLAQLSYGAYIATQYKPLPDLRADGRRCKACGAPLRGRQKAYCSEECKRLGQREQALWKKAKTE